MSHKHAVTSVPVLDMIKERWSPRAFDSGVELSDDIVVAALEAARWAPSANNSQPARFVVAKRGTREFDIILQHLVPVNAEWAQHASALVANIAAVRDTEGNDRPWA
ncbi:MAG: nitroreductase family protein, partial [Microbacteriaceae bacterium]